MIAGVSGVLLFIFMFFDWYGIEVEGQGIGEISGGGFNAWEAFGLIDLILFLAIAVAVALAALRAAGAMPELPQPPGLIVAAAGAVALLLVLFRLIVTPGNEVEGFGTELDITRKIGVFLGLIASAGIAFGGYTAMRERGTGTGDAPPTPTT